MPGGSIRLFVGVPVPDAAVASAAAAAGRLLTDRSARVVPAGSHHVTLRFLGAVTEGDLPSLVAAIALATSDVPATSARLRGLGAFPGGRRRARILWAGVADDGTLARLAAALRDLPGDRPQEPFVAHVTLARYDPPARVPEASDAPGGPVGEAFPVDRVVLYRSRPGSAYEPLEIFPLGR
ncbi:MAG: RNA 2',3'-cyclic phosphodiesterase [Actinomycetota bacterium]